MTMFDTRPRAGPRWVGFPGQVRTVNVTGWPDGYLDARTYELHLFRQGHHTPVVVEVTQDDTTLTAEVTVPLLAGEWAMYLMEVIDDDLSEPRLRVPFASSRSAATGPQLPVDVPVEVVDGDELTVPVELSVVENGGVGSQGPAGPEGPEGPAGPEGPDGLQGPAGPQGLEGDDGADGVDGTDGADGDDGAPGADGKTVRNGTGAPAGGLGVDGDFYIDSAADAVYGPKTAGAWGSATPLVGPEGPEGDQGPQGLAGDDGADGADGSPGAPGADGRTVLNGSGAPGGGLGSNGDFYIDTTADTIYGPKTAGAWGSPTSLIGPEGTEGPEGPEGPQGDPGSDATVNSTNVNAAGAVMETDYDANTVLAANADNTPLPITMGASTILARLATGDIIASTPAQLRTLLGVTSAIDQLVIDLILAGAIRTRTINQYYFSSTGATNVTDVPTQSRLYLIPVTLAAGTIDRIGFDCVTGVASLVARLGIYTSTADMPGTLIAEATATADCSATAVLDKTISAVIPAVGMYWLAIVFQGAAPIAGSVRCVTAAQPQLDMPVGTSAPTITSSPGSRYQDSVTGALGTVTVASGSNHTSPRIFYRYSA